MADIEACPEWRENKAIFLDGSSPEGASRT
jgi:hypothetical protein